MIPESKGLNPHELAHRWVNDLVLLHDMRILGRVLCASGTCLARTEAERRRGSA